MANINKNCILFLLIIIKLKVICGFNLSPVPNLVIREPQNHGKIKVRSSYFGFSLNLRSQSLIVGAPRAQSSLEHQKYIDEPGVIYKCSATSGECSSFDFETLGNTRETGGILYYTSETRNNQWLGASMDGGIDENDRFVVCAPRLFAATNDNHFLHGMCYWVPNTKGNTPVDVKKIAPLREKGKQTKLHYDNSQSNFYGFGEGGFSVHITEDNKEILLGAPGIDVWRGSMVRYYSDTTEGVGLNRRRRLDTQSSNRVKRNTPEYFTNIPDPEIWQQGNDSYFGYSITSGFFEGKDSKQILYVASAPHANWQQGEVYLFDIIDFQYWQKSIQINYVFVGKQFGEFFGYAVLSEDFNGDNLTDIAISAPLHKTGSGYDNGAVYIFMNKGKLNFELSKILTSEGNLPSRFGTTLTRLGDLDNDGFNDIGIGAPFEKNGTVYIHLGSPLGISDKPSQILRDPNKNSSGQHMFGHGLSQGADVDGNGYKDFAVGAPNSEEVYLYKAYPVVKIIATVKSSIPQINSGQKQFKVEPCWQLKYNTDDGKQFEQEIKIVLKIDPRLKRASFSDNQNYKEFTRIASKSIKCETFEARIQSHAEVSSRPIVIEMSYDLVNKIPESTEFQDGFVALSPLESNATSDKIAVTTGCKHEVCLANLKVSSSSFEPAALLGSKLPFSVNYTIRNEGETAYLPQIHVKSTNGVRFAKIPPLCIVEWNVLICDLFGGRPMLTGQEDILTVAFDTGNIDGKSFNITAEVKSTGDELDTADNVAINKIEVHEYSAIDFGKQREIPVLILDDSVRTTEVINTLEIINLGPSNIHQMKVIMSIPTSYSISNKDRKQIVSANTIQIDAIHNNRSLNVVYNRFKKGIVNAFPQIPGYINFLNTTENNNVQDEFGGRVPVDTAIYFNCSNFTESECLKAEFNVFNLKPGNNPVSIIIRFDLNLKQIERIISGTKDFFIFTITGELLKTGDEEGISLSAQNTMLHTIISRHKFSSIPIWVYLLAVIGGILILILLIYLMYLAGFFRRKKKEELNQRIRESQRGPNSEAEGLMSRRN